MPRARDVVRLLLVCSAPAALLVVSFSGGQHLQPAPSVDSRLRWQWRWCQGSKKRCRGSFSSSQETATSPRYHCCSRLTVHCCCSRLRVSDQDLASSAHITTATVDDDSKEMKSSGRSQTNGDNTPAGAAAVAGTLSPPGSTRYTIDMDVHPDVADVAVKHACQLSRFLEHHPISAHTEQAYALATKFVRDFHLSRQGSGDGQAGLGQVQGRGGEEGGQEEEEEAVQQLLQRPLPVVLDAGCGTGRSSILLAKSHPHLPVLGVDRSAVRLSKGHGASRDNESSRGPTPRGSREGRDLEREGHEQVGGGVIADVSGGGVERAVPSQGGPGGGGGGDGDGGGGRKGRRRRGEGTDNPHPNNLLLLRADLVDLWILASRDNAWKVEEHSILYPNPYPKRSQLRSRWHGHPVFPVLLGLGGRITLRSNWKPYLDEVCQAVLAISAEGKEGDAAGGGTGGGAAAGEPLLVGREGRQLSANGVGAETRGAAGGSVAAAAAPAAAAVTAARASPAGSAALSMLAGGRGENEAPAEGGDGANAAACRYAGRSYARGQDARPRDQLSSKTAECVRGGGAGAADATAAVPAAIAAAAAPYEASARAGPSLYVPVVPATNFEAKYKAVGETVYELRLEPRLTR